VAGNHVPDVVGNLRYDQAWGSLHFGAAAHEVHGTYYAGNSDSGHPGSTYGYAVTGAFELKNLFGLPGDSFRAEATFAHGAAKYVFAGTVDTAGAGRFARTSGTDPGTLAIGYVLDGVYAGTAAPGTQTNISLSNAWEVDAWYEHYWTPQWRTSLFGTYEHISYGAAGNAQLFAALSNPAQNPTTGWINAGTSNGDMSLSTAQIGTKSSWMPVKDLTFSFEFLYSRVMPNVSGTFTNAGIISGATAGTVWTLGAQNIYNGAVQVIRSF
jgi:hypothetical protein